MNRLFWHRHSFLWLAFLWAGAGCSPSVSQVQVRGVFLNQPVSTTVDSEIAKYFLESYLRQLRENPDFDRKIEQVYRNYPGVPDREGLHRISDSLSTDFAALFLAVRLHEVEANRRLQEHFYRTVGELKASAKDGGLEAIPQAKSYLILFVPGWDYKENGSVTGSDFAVPQKLITQLGMETHLVPIDPVGSVEANADVIAAEVIKSKEFGKKVVLVGASSAGPAIHLALGKTLASEEQRHVLAWLNLGGVLQGSPLVEHMDEWPRKPLFNLIVGFKGWKKENVLSMSTAMGRKRFQELTLPPNLLVVNYMGLSLSGQLSKYSRDKYPVLKEQGPNDGLTLLADMIAPNSATIVAFGSDHFFAEDPDINLKTIALAHTIIQELEAGPDASGYSGR
jgi:hypothetical protein